MRRLIMVVVLVLCFGTVNAYAEDFNFDFDSMFDDDLFFEVEEEIDYNPEDILLVNDGWELGGNYNFSVRSTRSKVKGIEPITKFSSHLGGSLFLDSRPDVDKRFFSKVDFNYPVNSGDKLQINLMELFADYNWKNKVFFRAGKQNVSWGVGHFFSPADVINIGRKDPMDPDADLEGPVTLKAQTSAGNGRHNYYLYTLFDGVEHPKDVGVALKAEYVIGTSEVGFGTYLQRSKAPRLSMTMSSSVGQVALFGEAVVSKGSDKGFVGEWSLFDYPIQKKDDLFFHLTGGGMYRYSDPNNLFNFMTALQYYYNGEGYKDQQVIGDARKIYLAVSQSEYADKVAHVVPSDLFSTGRHYLAGMLSWNGMFDSDFSSMLTVVSNLSDKSGMVNTSLSLPAFSSIRPSVGANFTYGELGSEFGIGEPNSSVYFAVTLGSTMF